MSHRFDMKKYEGVASGGDYLAKGFHVATDGQNDRGRAFDWVWSKGNGKDKEKGDR